MAFKIACPCGFAAETPQAFLDHALATRHVELPVGPDSADLCELIEMIATIQAHAEASAQGETLPLPEGVEITPMSEEDILTDDELSEDEKQDVLAQLAKVKKLTDNQ